MYTNPHNKAVSFLMTTKIPSKLLSGLFVVTLLATACGSDAEPVSTAPDTPATSLPDVGAPDGDIDGDDQIPVEPDGGIGDTPFGEVPFFGGNDEQCASTVLNNEESDQANLKAGAECFIAELEAGTPVIWDLNQATVEGDPIFTRHIFDGDAVWLLNDDRADEYGSGSVRSERCESAELGSWGIVGATCVDAEYPGFAGFPEAE